MKQTFTLLGSLLMVLSVLVVPMVAVQGSALQGGNLDFDATAAEEEGYWYSRYNMGTLVMASGLGETFMPDMEMIQAMIQMADANPDDGDTVMPPMNAALLKAVYASGNPHYTQLVDVNDFGTQRWNPATFDTTITSRAMGWTIIKEVEWAKQFHVDDHFGTPDDNFGAQWRFVGLVLNAEAKMQAQYALQMLKNDQGLIANSDGTVDWGGQWVMLIAFSDLGSTLGLAHLPHSATNRYADPDAAAMFLSAADMLFGALASRQPADTEELSLAIQALVWYAANTSNADHQAQAISVIKKHADALANANKDTATRKAFAIRGLVEAYRVSGEAQYLTAAANVFNGLAAEYDAAHGLFSSQDTYTIDDVAVIMGAVNSLRLFGGSAVNQSKAEAIFAGFFESAVNLSGLQQSAPPKEVAKGTFEQGDPDIYYAYPGMPMPPMAGGEFGIAPVFATEVKWDGSAWRVTNGNFDSAGAMHASNEFIWFHNDEVNGFPLVTPLPVTGGPAPTLYLALFGVVLGLILILWLLKSG
ncbi:MAG: hypothetical protein ACUVX8_18360 [Candidatus Zipacnadales bacterium]